MFPATPPDAMPASSRAPCKSDNSLISFISSEVILSPLLRVIKAFTYVQSFVFVFLFLSSSLLLMDSPFYLLIVFNIFMEEFYLLLHPFLLCVFHLHGSQFL